MNIGNTQRAKEGEGRGGGIMGGFARSSVLSPWLGDWCWDWCICCIYMYVLCMGAVGFEDSVLSTEHWAIFREFR